MDEKKKLLKELGFSTKYLEKIDEFEKIGRSFDIELSDIDNNLYKFEEISNMVIQNDDRSCYNKYIKFSS
ncbi:MAG: hypothetical protein WA012_16795 [Rhodoferax sp.]|uniref:hypothetical protein n=1 Tax=Rhodoferax sp. TaxID=50421 RepID=UPI003BB74ECF